MPTKQLDDILIEAANSGHYFVTIHYQIGKKVLHSFVTKNFLVSDLERCLEELKKFIKKETNE